MNLEDGDGCGARIRVALLDDHAMFRDALCELLASEGFEARGASTPQELLELVSECPPDVVLVDLIMGGAASGTLEGLQVLRELAERFPAVRAIVLSGASGAELVHLCMSEGAAAFLPKSSTRTEQLLTSIRSALEARPEPGAQPDSAHQTALSLRPLAALTSRERQVLAHVAAGLENCDIATQLGIAERTVKSHIAAIYRKLRATNRVQLALMAQALVPPRAAGAGSGAEAR